VASGPRKNEEKICTLVTRVEKIKRLFKKKVDYLFLKQPFLYLIFEFNELSGFT